MKNVIALFAVLVVGTGGCRASPDVKADQFKDAGSKMIFVPPPSQPVRIVSDQQLRTTLSGNELVNYSDKDQKWSNYTETFNTDKNWSLSMESGTALNANGMWSIQKNEVCIAINGKSQQCRHLFIDGNNSFYIGRFDGLKNMGNFASKIAVKTLSAKKDE
jgi:hypothetical protein